MESIVVERAVVMSAGVFVNDGNKLPNFHVLIGILAGRPCFVSK
jgi:hypothetical protein